MEKVVEVLIAQQTEIYELLGEDLIPKKNPPITQENLTLLKSWWLKKGAPFPLDYERFLKICDGISNFSSSYDLFSSEILLSENYEQKSQELLNKGLGLKRNHPCEIIVLGWNDETRTRIFYESNANNSLVLYDGEPGFISMYDSFEHFLNLKVAANEISKKRILDMQNEISEDDT